MICVGEMTSEEPDGKRLMTPAFDEGESLNNGKLLREHDTVWNSRSTTDTSSVVRSAPVHDVAVVHRHAVTDV